MDIKNLNVYLLSTRRSVSPSIREKLDGFGVESFGFYHNYNDLHETITASSEACLIIDLFGDEDPLFNFDLEYFVSQAIAYRVTQALHLVINKGDKPIVTIDANFKITGECVEPDHETRDGLVRLPIYYFANGEVLKYVKADGIHFEGEKCYGLPIAFPTKELNYADKTPALFLDRDGIVNVDKGYVFEHENIVYKEDIFPIVQMFNDRFWPVFVVTNQSGIALGKYKEEDVHRLHKLMEKDFMRRGLKITQWQSSPYHYDKGVGIYKRKSFCRKPGSGMLLKILEEHSIDIENSYMIGDKVTDQVLIPGITALLLQGRYDLDDAHAIIFNDLTEIMEFIRSHI